MKEKIQQLIVQNNTEEAINQLLSVANESQKKDVLLLQARYRKMERENLLYLASREELSIEYNQLNYALLGLLDDIYDEPTNQGEPIEESDKSPKGNWWKWVVVIGAIFGIFASIAQISGIDILWFLKKETSETVNLTIHVHGPKGQRDIVLENEGSLSISLSDRMEERKIGSKGHTYFGNAASKLFGQELDVYLEADQYELAEESHKIRFDDSTIYLKVVPKSGKISDDPPKQELGPDPEASDTKEENKKENPPTSEPIAKTVLSLSPLFPQPIRVKSGKNGGFKFSLTNGGAAKAKNVRISSSNSAIQLQSNTRFNLQPGTTKTLSFALKTKDLAPGKYTGTISIKGDNVSRVSSFVLNFEILPPPTEVVTLEKQIKTIPANCNFKKIGCEIRFYDKFQKKTIIFNIDSNGNGQYTISESLKGDKVKVKYSCMGDVSDTQTVRVDADDGCILLPN